MAGKGIHTYDHIRSAVGLVAALLHAATDFRLRCSCHRCRLPGGGSSLAAPTTPLRLARCFEFRLKNLSLPFCLAHQGLALNMKSVDLVLRRLELAAQSADFQAVGLPWRDSELGGGWARRALVLIA